MIPLFGDEPGGWQAARYVALGGLITGVLGAVVAAIVKLVSLRHNQGRQSRKDSIEEAFKLLAVKDTEIADLRKDLHEVRNQAGQAVNAESRCRIELAATRVDLQRTTERVEMLEESMRAAGISIQVKPWKTFPDSSSHIPKSEGGK